MASINERVHVSVLLPSLAVCGNICIVCDRLTASQQRKMVKDFFIRVLRQKRHLQRRDVETSRFCHHFCIISSDDGGKMCFN